MVEYPMDDSQLYSDLLSPSVRVSFPVKGLSPTALREIGEVVRKFAWACEELSYMRDIPEHHRMFDYQNRIETLRAELKRIAKLHQVEIREGRPRNSEVKEHRLNTIRTVADFDNPRTQHFVGRGRR